MENWKGRTALITGVSSGIGAGLVERLTSRGVNVVGCARRADKLEELAEKVKDASGKFHPIKCDLRQEADILAMHDVIKKEHGGVDVCILNAGGNRSPSLMDGTTDAWREEWQLNVLSRCISTREFLKSMKERGVDDGHIVHINSIASHMVLSMPLAHHYSATKWACRALVLGLRQELRESKSNIRVTEICPGHVKTNWGDNAPGLGPEKMEEFYEENPHMKVEDIADAVEYVLSVPTHIEVHDLILTHPQDPIVTGGKK